MGNTDAKPGYYLALDLYSDLEKEENPIFFCKDLDELLTMMEFFFKNGYDVLIKSCEFNND